MKRKIILLTLAVVLLALPLMAAARAAYQEVIPLETGLVPEGITEGTGNTFYYGTLNGGGAIYRGDYRTGEIELVVDPDPSRVAVGMSFDQRTNLLYVAGAFAGVAHVFDMTDGSEVATIPLATPGNSLINDATVTQDAVYFTDSFNAFIYRVPLGEGGVLPDPATAESIALVGDYYNEPQPPAPEPFIANGNGIVATPNAKWLILVNSFTGILYRVNPSTGYAKQIDLGGDDVATGDGLVLRGHTLYVVQNYLNMIGVVELDRSYTTGSYVQALTSELFRIPTTAAIFGNALYAVNARFDEFDPFAPPPDAEFEAVRVEIN
jgi:hypothetical protein